jgi:hypothetical protein
MGHAWIVRVAVIVAVGVTAMVGAEWGWLIAAFVASMLLEIGGLALTIRDLVRAQRAAVDLAHPPESVPVTEEEIQQSTGGSRAARTQHAQAKRDSKQADEHVRDVVGRTLPTGRVRPLLGPGLIAVGIIVGTIANIVASD